MVKGEYYESRWNIKTDTCNDNCLCEVIKCLVNECSGGTGPTGPTGPAGGSYNASAMVHDESNAIVPINEAVKLSITDLSNGITYDSTTGEFTVPSDGLYLINWWFNVRSKNTNTECEPVALGIELHQTTPAFSLIAHYSTHNKLGCCDTGTINGNALFASNANSKFRFVNTSQTDIQLVPNDRYSASFSITRVN